VLKKQLKIEEEPWENYLIHDSKYFIPLLCHSKEQSIEEQILIAKFIIHSIKDESISEFKPMGENLSKELL
jgi:hypothetical protein